MPEQRDADVCIVGAGYAGLTAARNLSRAGRSIVVLEARDRVGGRVWTKHTASGATLDIGGTWIAPAHDAVRRLARELGVELYPTHVDGDSQIIGFDGRVRRYRGLVPPISPIAVGSLAQAMLRLDRMARRVDLDEPWSDRRARSWDARTAGGWIEGAAPTREAQHLLRASVRGLMTADPSEVSLLHLLYLIKSAGDLNTLLAVEGGYQQDKVVGGAGTMAERMAAGLGDAVQLETPVAEIAQDDGGVTVRSERLTIRARRAIVAAPPAIAARIAFEPALPPERVALMERMHAGAILKVLAVYDDAFWRADGLTAQAVALDSPIEMTLDASPRDARPGVIAAFAFGPGARVMRRLSPEARRELVIDSLVQRFGAKAARPAEYVEHDWELERWTRGCSMAHLAPGVLTQYGHALRPPCGRVHWAGTETATVSHGAIDGAIRSGERAARECLDGAD